MRRLPTDTPPVIGADAVGTAIARGAEGWSGRRVDSR
jgi:hypothetical protein